jgi:hypothetical protein
MRISNAAFGKVTAPRETVAQQLEVFTEGSSLDA